MLDPGTGMPPLLATGEHLAIEPGMEPSPQEAQDVSRREVDRGVVQQLTPSIDALVVPNIDDSLDEEAAKRAFWSAFRVLGEWYADLPPY